MALPAYWARTAKRADACYLLKWPGIQVLRRIHFEMWKFTESCSQIRQAR